MVESIFGVDPTQSSSSCGMGTPFTKSLLHPFNICILSIVFGIRDYIHLDVTFVSSHFSPPLPPRHTSSQISDPSLSARYVFYFLSLVIKTQFLVKYSCLSSLNLKIKCLLKFVWLSLDGVRYRYRVPNNIWNIRPYIIWTIRLAIKNPDVCFGNRHDKLSMNDLAMIH